MTSSPPLEAPSPSPSPLPLASQVGGHSGVLTTEDGSLLIKPALPLELHFYQTLLLQDAFEPLRPYIPRFLGTLKLEGEVDETTQAEGIVVKPVADQKDDLVLENLSHPFVKPNIIDIKLGTVLYDESASPDKIARMQKTASDTTSLESGVRLTGFQVYDNTTGAPVNTPKSYGKTIKVSDLPDGIARFFPVGTASPSSTREAPPATTTTTTKPSHGLPLPTLLPMLKVIRAEVAEIRDAFAEIHMRMVGGSLLIIYEADWERAQEGVQRFMLDEDEDEDEDEEEEEEEEEEESDDEAEDEKKKPGPPHVVKLIDFAHTRMKPGDGPDEGVLLGMDTVLKLLDGRIEQLGTDSPTR